MWSLKTRCGLLALFALWLGATAPLARADESGGVDFFEKKIRPVLVKECYLCHSANSKKLRGGLRVDSRAGLLEGGDSGPALQPGKPEESLLLEALRYDELKMPPKGKLPAAVIADFEHWIQSGAVDPRGEKVKATMTGIDVEAGRRFWAYQKPRHHESPVVSDRAWPRSDIDRFILGTLEQNQLHPMPDAGKAELLRRLYFDLIGLPPSPEEIEAFERDARPNAIEHWVDQLLASPHFGERWGRHWLDVVRFAESLTLRGFVLKQTWRYRDYVIDAWNADMPFDRFIREQVAGDLLPFESVEDRRRHLIAPMVLLMGDTNLEEQDKRQLRMDVVDEQVDTLGKAFLAQTIGCARCHDHKFDPIPTKDYYALAGIFRNLKALEHANVSVLLSGPLPEEPKLEALMQEQEAAIAALEARIKTAKTKIKSSTRDSVAGEPGVVAAKDLPGIVVDDSQATQVGSWKKSQHSKTYVGSGYLHDLDTGKGEKSLTFHPEITEAGIYEIWLAYSPGSNRSSAVPITILSADGETVTHIDERVPPAIKGRFTSLGRFRFERNGQGYVLVANEGTTGHVIADAVLFIPVADVAKAMGTQPSGALARASRDPSSEVEALEAELKQVRARARKREVILMAKEETEIADCPVHIRGSVHNLGAIVPRGFLSVATSGDASTFSRHESGRRELAEWLASRDNPLTARVIVNRVWSWLFGVGLVRTTDNFGTTGDLPSHPELLDELTLRFIEDGWSIKSLVRRIVLSHAYQVSSADDSASKAKDPENRWLWRSHHRRLDAEAIRDAILSVSGQLRLEMGGAGYRPELPSDYGFPQVDTRRSVYLPVFRNALPEIFSVFDFADPGMVVGQRNVSTVVPQSLFLMNHPFVVAQARLAAQRLLARGDLRDDDARLTRVYLVVLGRRPTDSERRIGQRFLDSVSESRSRGAKEEAWAILFQTLIASIDFRYVK